MKNRSNLLNTLVGILTIVSIVFGFVGFMMNSRITNFENSVELNRKNIKECIEKLDYIQKRLPSLSSFQTEAEAQKEYKKLLVDMKKVKALLSDQHQKLELLNNTINLLRPSQ